MLSDVRRYYSLSPNAFGIGRAVIGYTLAVDTLLRLFFLLPHYSREGFLPLDYLETEFLSYPHPLLFGLSDSLIWAGVLLMAQTLLSLAWAMGRLNHVGFVVLVVLTLSTLYRNVFFNDAGDDFLRCAFVLLLFVPAIRHRHVFSSWTVALHVQVFCLYFFSWFIKTGDAWHKNGNALELAMSLDYFRTPFTDVTLKAKTTLSFLVSATGFLEVLGALTLMIAVVLPIAFTRKLLIKKALLLSFIVFHLGTAVLLNLWFFALYCIGVLIMLWPGVAERMGEGLKEQSSFSTKASSGLGWAVVGLILIFNIFDIGQSPFLTTLSNWSQLRQRWGMFTPSPRPATEHISFWIDGETEQPLLDYHRALLWHLPQQGRLIYGIGRYLCAGNSEARFIETRLQVEFAATLGLSPNMIVPAPLRFDCRDRVVTRMPSKLLSEEHDQCRFLVNRDYGEHPVRGRDHAVENAWGAFVQVENFAIGVDNCPLYSLSGENCSRKGGTLLVNGLCRICAVRREAFRSCL